MSQTGLEVFDRTIQITNIWLDDLMERTGWVDRHRAYCALRAVLHAMRDHLSIDEMVSLGAQMPLLVRGIYFEGWHPAHKPIKERHREAFLARVADEFHGEWNVDSEGLTRMVLGVLTSRLSQGEVEKIKKSLPHEIRDLWP